jgi:hypothetical protein
MQLDPHVVEHCALETFSVLTRLPPPHRASGTIVRDFLASWIPRKLLRLSPRSYERFVLTLPDHGVVGGAAYDAAIAATAVEHEATLLTCDRRGLPTYERYGVEVELV